MKKIALIGVSVVLLIMLILFFPVPKGTYDDGGSREYEALTYKIIRWNRITDKGVYRKTRLYFGTDKHRSIDELFAREVPDMSTVDDPPIPDTVNFEAQYIRTNGYHEEAIYPAVTLIRSVQELTAYYNQTKDLYDLDRREHPASDSTIGFLDACDRYDDAYFAEHDLIVVFLEESSGSIRHKVNRMWDVFVEGKRVYNISITSFKSMYHTEDMAQWHILIELPEWFHSEPGEEIPLVFKER